LADSADAAGEEHDVGDFDWQVIVALLCVGGALAMLARRVLALWRGGGAKHGGCGTSACGGCSPSGPAQQVNLGKARPLVELDLTPRHGTEASGADDEASGADDGGAGAKCKTERTNHG